MYSDQVLCTSIVSRSRLPKSIVPRPASFMFILYDFKSNVIVARATKLNNDKGFIEAYKLI